jgi:hypothetical protein
MANEITNDLDLSKPGFHLLPAQPGTCEECATKHDPTYPHNQQSFYYQYHFYADHNRFPTWKDAMAHCSEGMQKLWIEELAKRNIEIGELPVVKG